MFPHLIDEAIAQVAGGQGISAFALNSRHAFEGTIPGSGS